MRKLLTLTVVGVIVTAPAIAVQKCVALQGNNTTCSAPDTNTGKADWSATCTTNGISLNVAGVAACSTSRAIAAGERIYSDLTTETTYDDTNTVNCWCKLVSPAVSYWVYANKVTDVKYCQKDCSELCRFALVTNTGFRSSILTMLH